jgi:hypothetical protein
VRLTIMKVKTKVSTEAKPPYDYRGIAESMNMDTVLYLGQGN